jgi:hypothetical protein
VPTPDETLAAIDDVIEWHGSADAMVWTAEAPAPRDVWVEESGRWAVQIEDWAREQGLVMPPFQRRYLNAIIQTTRHLRTHASGGEVSPRSPQ